MSLLRHFAREKPPASRRSPLSDADTAQRVGLALGAVVIAVLIAGVWLVVRGLA